MLLNYKNSQRCVILVVERKELKINTFLPYSDFQKSAQCLDYRRLGKQRVEAWQIYQTLKKRGYQSCLCGCNEVFNGHCVGCNSKIKKTAWYNHPIVKMWSGFENSLLRYGMAICEEWKSRNYNDNMLDKFISVYNISKDIKTPKWLGNKKFHSAMRSNLLRKDKNYYSKFGWKEKNNLPYYWIKE